MLDYKIMTFLKVCDTLNYTKAAEELHITQPAVSRHIHCLEAEYGVKLFDYKNKKITLTPEGATLRSYASAMKSDMQIIIDELRRGVTKRKDIRFGTTKTVGDFSISKPLQAYMETHLDTDVHMIVGNTEELLDSLRTGSINFALVEGYFNSAEFDSIKYSTEDFIAVCASKHRFVKHPKLVSDLLGENLLIREPGSGTRDILEKDLKAKNLSIDNFARAIEIGSMHVITSLVAGDFGISFMYKAAAADDIRDGLIKEIKLNDFNVQHDFSFIWSKGSVHSGIYQDICEFFQNNK